jgi:hypothetical protein
MIFMKSLKNFHSFKLTAQMQSMIKGGDTCSDCVHSAFIACDASCGGGGCSYSQCVISQASQCLGQSYCNQQ